MRSRPSKFRVGNKRIVAADVGRYLKQLAALNRDSITGNPALSAALLEVSQVLMQGKSVPAGDVLEKHMTQSNFEFEEDIDFDSLTLEKAREIIARSDLRKSDLVIVGTERFGIAKSRLDRMPREEIIKTILSAIQHEESLMIISKEARRHSRSS